MYWYSLWVGVGHRTIKKIIFLRKPLFGISIHFESVWFWFKQLPLWGGTYLKTYPSYSSKWNSEMGSPDNLNSSHLRSEGLSKNLHRLFTPRISVSCMIRSAKIHKSRFKYHLCRPVLRTWTLWLCRRGRDIPTGRGRKTQLGGMTGRVHDFCEWHLTPKTMHHWLCVLWNHCTRIV